MQWVGDSDMVAYGFPDAATLPLATGAGEPDSDYIEDPTGVAASSTSGLGVQFVGGIERVLRDSVRLGTWIRWAQFQRKAINEAQFWSASVTLRYEF